MAGTDADAELMKNLRKPEVFKFWICEEEQQHFEAWAFVFRTWLQASDPAYKNDLDRIESHLERPISLEGAAREVVARACNIGDFCGMSIRPTS